MDFRRSTGTPSLRISRYQLIGCAIIDLTRNVANSTIVASFIDLEGDTTAGAV